MTGEAPSKTELLERRAERELVIEGKAVLEERRDLLAHLMLEQISALDALLAELGELYTRARQDLRNAVLRHGLAGLVPYAEQDSALPDPEWRVANRFGTAWLDHQADRLTPSASYPATEIRAGSIELAQAQISFQQLSQLLVAVAAVDNNLRRLTDAFRRTQRRVNALEHIVLPELVDTIATMQAAMDEMERDGLTRTLLVKRRQSMTEKKGGA